MKVIVVLVLLFLVLLVACLVAPWLGVDSGDARSERAHPDAGWFPTLPTR
jgi:hypothetical protein